MAPLLHLLERSYLLFWCLSGAPTQPSVSMEFRRPIGQLFELLSSLPCGTHFMFAIVFDQQALYS